MGDSDIYTSLANPLSFNRRFRHKTWYSITSNK